MRLALAKSLHASYPGGVAGKYTSDKAAELTRNWAKFVERECADLDGMALELGITKAAEDETLDDGDVIMLIPTVTLQCLLSADDASIQLLQQPASMTSELIWCIP